MFGPLPQSNPQIFPRCCDLQGCCCCCTEKKTGGRIISREIKWRGRGGGRGYRSYHRSPTSMYNMIQCEPWPPKKSLCPALQSSTLKHGWATARYVVNLAPLDFLPFCLLSFSVWPPPQILNNINKIIISYNNATPTTSPKQLSFFSLFFFFLLFHRHHPCWCYHIN